MEIITSRQNKKVSHLRALGRDRAYRRESGEYLCDGEKLLAEALNSGAEISCVAAVKRPETPLADEIPFIRLTRQLFDYITPLKNSPGPLFSCAIPISKEPAGRIIILDGVQDPGNVGTVLRSAGAFGVGTVILTGGSADPWNFKTVRAAMGASFRVRILEMSLGEIAGLGLPIYGAAASEPAEDIRLAPLSDAAIAVGSEGRGLSPELRVLCSKMISIPMADGCESLNAAVAASIIMWQMCGSNP